MARRAEMLDRAALVIAGVRDRGDDRRLAVLHPIMAMPARSRSRDRTPSAATKSCAASVRPSPSVAVTCSGPDSNPTIEVSASTTPSSLALLTSAASSGAFSIICANGSPGSTSPPKVRKTGRTASSSRLSVTTMSTMSWASDATACQTPIVSKSRRAAAAIAEARASIGGRASEGSATVTEKSGPSAWRSATASASPANPPPPMRISVRSAVMSFPTPARLLARPPQNSL